MRMVVSLYNPTLVPGVPVTLVDQPDVTQLREPATVKEAIVVPCMRPCDAKVFVSLAKCHFLDLGMRRYTEILRYSHNEKLRQGFKRSKPSRDDKWATCRRVNQTEWATLLLESRAINARTSMCKAFGLTL